MSGKFEPGQKLTSRKLAAALGTSDMPVRAAISRLTAEGGLVQRSNGTFIVPRVTRPAFKELMELRSLLEGRATSLACARIDVDGLRRLHKYSDELDRAAAADDIVKYLDVNQKLKFTIYSYCESPKLYSLIEILWLQAVQRCAITPRCCAALPTSIFIAKRSRRWRSESAPRRARRSRETSRRAWTRCWPWRNLPTTKRAMRGSPAVRKSEITSAKETSWHRRRWLDGARDSLSVCGGGPPSRPV